MHNPARTRPARRFAPILVAVALFATACGGTEITAPSTTAEPAAPAVTTEPSPSPPETATPATEAPPETAPAPEGVDLDFSDLEVLLPLDRMTSTPAGLCGNLDIDEVGEILGFDVYVGRIERRPALSPARDCRIYDDATEDLLYSVEVIGDADRTYLEPSAGSTGFTPATGLGDSAGVKVSDDDTPVLKMEAAGTEFYISASRSDDDFDTMALVLAQTIGDLWNGWEPARAGALQTCDEIPVDTLAGSALGPFHHIDLDFNAGCVAIAESGDRLLIRSGQWRRAERWFESHREDHLDRDWGSLIEIDDPHPELTDVFFVDDRNAAFGMTEAVDIDSIWMVSGPTMFNVSVMGQAATDNTFSPQELHDLAVEYLYGSEGTIRFYEEYDWLPLGACGVFLEEDAAERVDCTESHDYEVYAVLESPSETFVDFYDDESDDPCYPEFLAITGVDIFDSTLSGEIEAPSETDFDRGFPEVRCMILFPDQPTAALADIDLSNGYGGAIPWSQVTADTCVADTTDIQLVRVWPSDCVDDEIDVLGLVDPANLDIYAACESLANEAGYGVDAWEVETSNILVRRGFPLSICFAYVG